jgi:hypothetical protein
LYGKLGLTSIVKEHSEEFPTVPSSLFETPEENLSQEPLNSPKGGKKPELLKTKTAKIPSVQGNLTKERAKIIKMKTLTNSGDKKLECKVINRQNVEALGA